MKSPAKIQSGEISEDNFRQVLRQELVRRSRGNPAYSLRAFAKSLQIDASTLAKLLNGKRSLGKNTIKRLGARLGFNESELAQFATQSLSQTGYQSLSLDAFQVIADWQHFAILELMRVESFRPDAKWVAQVLALSADEAQASIDRLCRLGLLEINERREWREVGDEKTTLPPMPFSSSAHRTLQKQILQKAIEALETRSIEERDQSAVTMAIDVNLLPEAKEKIKIFRRQLAKFLSRSTGTCQEVYNLSVSLYPLSQVQNKKKEGHHEK